MIDAPDMVIVLASAAGGAESSREDAISEKAAQVERSRIFDLVICMWGVCHEQICLVLSGFGYPHITRDTLNVEAELHHVTVLHDVVLTLHTDLALSLGFVH